MKPSEIFATARRSNNSRILQNRNKLDSFLIAIPLSAIAKLIIRFFMHDPAVALSCTSLLYVSYIGLLRVSNVISEYDTGTGNPCKIAIFYILSKWTILSCVCMEIYPTYSLAFIINMIVPDVCYYHTGVLLCLGYITHLASSKKMQLVTLYPMAVFVLSFFHFLMQFQEIRSKRMQRVFSGLIITVNILFTIYIGTAWWYFLYLQIQDKSAKRLEDRFMLFIH